MKKIFLTLGIGSLFALPATAQNVGVGTTTPQAKLSVGTNSEFRVDDNGNIIRINNVPLSFPAAQGGSGQVLTNNGTGTLSWTTPASGAFTVCGDGSAGALSVSVGTTLDLTNNASVLSLPSRHNLNFTNITIAGTLIVPSGTVLKATGTVTITGTVTVAAGSNASSVPRQGVAQTAADTYFGGVGLGSLQAGNIVMAPLQAGGSGKAQASVATVTTGGEGGGGLTIYAKGNIAVTTGASINANGASGVNPQSAGVSMVGTGGGAGGIIVLATKGTLTVGGTIRANGGNGADGFNGNGGTGEGGGGGGGGGIVVLMASSSPAITGTLQTIGGAGGANAAAVSPSTTILTAYGGGACGGNGGNGGGIIPGTTTNANASAGAAGYAITIVLPDIDAYIPGRH